MPCTKTIYWKWILYTIVSNSKSTLPSISNGYLCTNSCAGQYITFEETNICKTKCPDNRVIIDGVCKLHEQCKNHPLIERTLKGKVCKHGCSKGTYMNGTNCINSCPSDLYVFNNTCVQECPKYAPYLWKSFGATVSRKCLSHCPFFMVINGSDCINIVECVGFLKEKDFAIHDGVCVKECPSGMIRFKDTSCQYIWEFVVPIVICFLISIGCLITIIKMVSWRNRGKKKVALLQVRTLTNIYKQFSDDVIKYLRVDFSSTCIHLFIFFEFLVRLT